MPPKAGYISAEGSIPTEKLPYSIDQLLAMSEEDLKQFTENSEMEVLDSTAVMIVKQKEKMDIVLKIIADPLKKNQTKSEAKKKKDDNKEMMDLVIALKGKFDDKTYDLADLKNGSRVSAIRDKLAEKAGLKKSQYRQLQLQMPDGEVLSSMNTAIANTKLRPNDTVVGSFVAQQVENQ